MVETINPSPPKKVLKKQYITFITNTRASPDIRIKFNFIFLCVDIMPVGFPLRNLNSCKFQCQFIFVF